MSKPKITVLIADDHEVVREGVRNLLSDLPDIEICAEATNGRDAVKLAEKKTPEIAVLDLSMPDLNGIDATRQIRKLSPATRILIFSMHETEQLVREVFRAGASGYVLKSDASKHLIAAVRALHEGRHFCSSKLNEIIFEGFIGGGVESSKEATSLESLTPREREIMQLLAEGKSNKEVAQVLGISVKTAETHRAAIMRKLRLATFSDLVRYAIRNKLIEA